MKAPLYILILHTFTNICQSQALENGNIAADKGLTIPFTNISTVAHRRVRRRYVVRCCGGRSCSYSSRSRFMLSRWGSGWTPPDRDVDLRGGAGEVMGGDRAVATLRDGGISVSCPGCAPGWQQQLKISPEHGHIPIVCPGCDSGWRQWLSQDAYAAALDASTTTTAAPEEITPEGGEPEEETEKPVKTAAPKQPKLRPIGEKSIATKKPHRSSTPQPPTSPPEAQTPNAHPPPATYPPPTAQPPPPPQNPITQPPPTAPMATQPPTQPPPPPPPQTQPPPPPPPPTQPTTTPPPTTAPPPTQPPPPIVLPTIKAAEIMQAGQSLVEGMVKMVPTNFSGANVVGDMANVAGAMAKTIPGASDVLNTFGKFFG